MGNFALDWDDAKTQDLVLRRRFGSGEEIALSALLGPLIYEGKNPLPRHALMKVFVKKPDPEPILQFDCTVFHQDHEADSEFVIENVKYLSSTDPSRSSRYRGPSFRWNFVLTYFLCNSPLHHPFWELFMILIVGVWCVENFSFHCLHHKLDQIGYVREHLNFPWHKIVNGSDSLASSNL